MRISLQIQLILYETHSALEAENQVQVTRAVAEANRLARDRHALLKKKNRHSVSFKYQLTSLGGYKQFGFICTETSCKDRSPHSHSFGRIPMINRFLICRVQQNMQRKQQ